MPILTPILDSRTWDDLRSELVARIPVYNPEWTDHHPSDPGITLLELAAYLGETALFKFNQIPETARLEFLKLLDTPLEPPRPATTYVELATLLTDGPLAPISTRFNGGGIDFESVDETRVWPIQARAAIKRNTSLPTDPELLDFIERTERQIEFADGQVPAYYTTTFSVFDPANSDVAILDTDDTPDRTLWVAVVAQAPNGLDLARGELLNIGFSPTDEAPSLEDIEPCPGLGSQETAPSVRWRISTGVVQSDNPIYAELDVESDTTRGLTQAGIVRLRIPPATEPVGLFPTNADLEGAADRPPLLAADDVDGEVLCWLRVDRPTPGDSLGKVRWIGANAVEVRAQQSAAAEQLGVGDGDADQGFSLAHRNALVDSIDIQVEETQGWTSYQIVSQFLPAGNDERQVRIDLEAGVVTFGRPPHQRVPQIGERIRVGRYKWGGGSEGNVPAGSIDSVVLSRPVSASQPLDAVAGADGESITDGLDRVSTEVRRRNRAVTASDFDELARRADPDVARAETLPLFRPSEPNQTTPGAVTVVVWPKRDAVNPGAPTPTRSLLRRVCSYLDYRRLVTTEMYVVPPTYVPIVVSVGMAVKPGYGVDAVRRWIELVIRQYLAPVPPYGPEGNGWPLGRRVLAAELEAAALQVEGAQFLTGLFVSAVDDSGQASPPVDAVLLEDWQIPELVDITVVEGPPLAPGDQPTEQTGQLPVPVPEITEEC